MFFEYPALRFVPESRYLKGISGMRIVSAILSFFIGLARIENQMMHTQCGVIKMISHCS